MTVTSIDETQASGRSTAQESEGNAAAAYPSDEEILGIGDGAIDAPPRATSDGDAAPAAENKDRSETAEDSEINGNKGEAANKDETQAPDLAAAKAIPKEFEQVFATAGTGLKLREIYEREANYRALFPTVDEARKAGEAQRELARVDELFESGDPAAHVELMAGLAQRDPAAFRSLAATFGERLVQLDPEAHRVISNDFASAALEAARLPEQIELLARAAEKGDAGAVKFLAGELAGRMETLRSGGGGADARTAKNKEGSFAPLRMTTSGLGRTAVSTKRDAMGKEGGQSQTFGTAPTGAAGNAEAAGKFVESVNAEVEKSVEQAVGSRVAELLPEASDTTRRKISADIYRELDAALKKDTALLQQVSANFAAAHQSGQFGDQQKVAMATLVLGKAKAVLPGVAKRVVGEWTTAVMSASQSRRAKQGAAAARADVGVGGSPRPVSTQVPRVDYGKMSDEEILNADLP